MGTLLLGAAVPAVAQTGQTTADGTAPPAAKADTDAQRPPVDLTLVYTAELRRNARGGLARGTRYLDNIDVTLTVDAGRAIGWRGATLFAYGLYNNGRPFSADLVGDVQTVSNIETTVRAVRLYEAWAEQRFAAGRGSVRAGLYDLNSEFDVTGVGALFLLSSHGIGPEFGQAGLNGPSIFPVTSIAVRGAWRMDDRLTLRAAVLDGVPGDPDQPRRTAVRLGGGDGALLVGEAERRGGRTRVAVGYWRFTARLPTIAGPDRRGSEGAYLTVDHRLTKAERGWAAFAQLGVADARFYPVASYAGGGLVRTGLFRADDQAGVSIARAAFGRRFRRAGDATRAETIVEATYRTSLTRWLTVQPDLQYVVDPGGDRDLRDALVLGLRVEAAL